MEEVDLAQRGRGNQSVRLGRTCRLESLKHLLPVMTIYLKEQVCLHKSKYTVKVSQVHHCQVQIEEKIKLSNHRVCLHIAESGAPAVHVGA